MQAFGGSDDTKRTREFIVLTGLFNLQQSKSSYIVQVQLKKGQRSNWEKT